MLAMLGAIAAVACGGDVPVASTTQAVEFTMVAQNGSGVAGTGMVVKGADSFTVTIKLSGLMPNSSHVSHLHARSEERRVGKECRSRWSPYH